MNTATLIKHNFYQQSGSFSFLLDLIIDNVTGIVNFGFSGSSGNLFNFSCKSGKFIDHKNNYIDSYLEDERSSISGNISSTSVDYFINDNPAAFGLPRPTGKLDYFYINPLNCEVDFDLFLNGEKPNYTLTYPTIFNSGITNIPITITNNSLPFKIFTGIYQGNISRANLSGVPTNVPTGVTGFYIRQSGISGNVTFPFELLTNFGAQDFTLVSYGG